jgi:hypothetical protein
VELANFLQRIDLARQSTADTLLDDARFARDQIGDSYYNESGWFRRPRRQGANQSTSTTLIFMSDRTRGCGASGIEAHE